MMATCSLDGYLKLWNIESGKLEKKYKDSHSREIGKESTAQKIRGMAYSEELGGNFVTWGFHNYVSLWNPFANQHRPNIGKYEQHSGIILDCKFCRSVPNCISLDDKDCLRIWDIRNF